MKVKRIILALAALFYFGFAAAPVSAAYNPFSQACQGAGRNATACSANGSTDPISGTHGILRRAATIIALIAGVAAMIVIVVSGFMFITSGGDPQKAKSARSALIGSIIGLIIIVAAQTILVFVLKNI